MTVAQLSDMDAALDAFDGFAWIPGVAQILAGFREALDAARTGRMPVDATQTWMPLIANPDGLDLQHLLALLGRELIGPANKALAGLDDETRNELQDLGDEHVALAEELNPRTCLTEAAGLISEHHPDC